MQDIPGLGLFSPPRPGRPHAERLRFAPIRFFLGACISGMLLSCNVTDRDLGEAPIGPRQGSSGTDSLGTGALPDSVSGNVRVFASPQTLKAGNKGRSIVTVQVADANGNPLPGRLVRFAASMGTITARDTTDADGAATAVFAALPRNGEVRVFAEAHAAEGPVLVGTRLQLEGLAIGMAPLSRDTLLDANVPLIVTITDGDGEPVAAAPVKLQGAAAAEGLTDGAGRFRTMVRSGKEGPARVTAEALGGSGSVSVGFWKSLPNAGSRTLALFADPPRIAAMDGETSRIRAVLYDDNHNPVAGKAVSFASSHGLISSSDTTDADGAAWAEYRGSAQNADVAITASYLDGDSTHRAVATVAQAGLQLEVRPAAGEALLRDTVPVSIRLRDAGGSPLPGIQIALKGALQSSLRTNASGAATATVSSATIRSMTVEASALGAADSGKVVFLQTLPTSSETSKDAIGNLRIFVDRSVLKASNTDETTVRVVAFDKFNNPLSGRPVRFTATHGIITAGDSTDSRGEATATYRAVPVNVGARITASMAVEDSALAVATLVTLSGLEVEVLPQARNALLNRTVPVLIRILDGSGRPVPDAALLFNGNPGAGTTDGEGVFRTAVTSGTQRRVTVSAKALGAADSNFVDFWSALPGGADNTVGAIRKMRIFASRSQLRADNSDSAIVSVILTNENNNPAVGETVRFTSDLGIIGQSAPVDSAGRAMVVLRSAPVNGICKVRATVEGSNLSAATEIAFSGVTLQLAASQADAKVGQAVEVEAFLRDASGNPIGGDPVSFTLSGPGAFDNGDAAYETVLDPVGKALVRIVASAAGSVRARASALNTSDSVNLRFTNNSLTLAVSRPVLSVGGTDSTLITATFVNGSGAPVSGTAVSFAANAGVIANATVNTDGAGKASTYLRSALFAGTATVQANASGGAAQAKVEFSAAAPRSVKLAVTADNIGINGGTAALRAVVADAEGNMVSGQNVNFRILRGPGGGENITKPVVQTQAGVALSELQAGSIASSYRGTVVIASVGALADTAKLTISGAAHIVTVSRPENDSVKVSDVGIIDESTFEYFNGAVVQDINGNMVADGTEVHFSAVVTGMAIGRLVFDRWDGLGTDSASVKAVYRTVMRDMVPFEDVNNNARYDAGIDLDLDGNPSILRRGEDRNGDGIFDYDRGVHDTWFDFNGNGVCDADSGESGILVDSVMVPIDLNRNGKLDPSEVLNRAGAASCNLPASGDYPYHEWESRDFLPALAFRDNEFAVAIEVSAVTRNGVAYARLRYPRQFARRLLVTVNAEANGIRDKDGERYLLPQIVK